MRVAIVDDEIHALERLKRVIEELENLSLCGLFEDSEDFLEYIKTNAVDVVFLDIEMPGKNGLEVALEILEINPSIEVVFVTAFNQYAVDAFEMNALDYIMKPLTAKRLQKTIERFQDMQKGQKTKGKPYIQCFGSFEIMLSGIALSVASLKVKELLAFLIHNKGVPIGWEVIVDALWPDSDYQKGHSVFHTTIFRLRKWLQQNGLEQIIENKRNNYRIVISEIDCDLYVFEKAENRIQMRQLYKGSYMGANGYQWAYPKQAELELKLLD